nr:hypothetical protein [Tanacetum cinerariifolium]
MTKIIKGEFEKLEYVKISDVSLTCNTSLEIFNEEFNRMSRMEDDLFTYEDEIGEVTNIPCDLKKEDDLEQQMSHESDNDMEYDPSDWARGDDEVELTNEESTDSDDEDEVANIFRNETNVFEFDTPLCRALKTYKEYKDDWIYEWNKDVTWVHERPWTENGVWKEPTPVKHHWNLPGACIIGNTLRYLDLEWYKALKDGRLKEEALKNKAIVDGMIDEDDESSNEGWKDGTTLTIPTMIMIKVRTRWNMEMKKDLKCLMIMSDITTCLVKVCKVWDDWEVDRYGNANLDRLNSLKHCKGLDAYHDQERSHSFASYPIVSYLAPAQRENLLVGDGGRRDKAILHMLCVLDGLLDVLVKGVKLVKFLLNLVSSHGWLGLSTQPTSREVDRWKMQTPGSGISILLAVGTPSTGSGNLHSQWELSPGSGNALCILFPTVFHSRKIGNGKLGGVEKVKPLGANGDLNGSRVGVVWMEVGGGIMRARVVSRVVVKVVLVMLIGFWVEELALEAMEYDNQRMGYKEGCLQVEVVHVKNRIKSVVVHMIILHPLVRIGEELSVKHSIWKCHLGTIGHTRHLVDDVVGKVKGFFNGEAIEHIAQTSILMVLDSSETYGIFTQDDFLFLRINFQLENNHLKRVKEEFQGIETKNSQLKGELAAVKIKNDTLRDENVSIKKRYQDLYKSKAESNSNVSSGAAFPEKPKVLAPGLYAMTPNYVPPQKRNNREVNTPLPRNEKVSSLKKPNVPVYMSTGIKSVTEASKSKSFASQVDVNNVLSKPVTPYYLPKSKEFVLAKPHHVIAPSSSRNTQEESYGSIDMAHNHYLEEARKKTQERNRNSKSGVKHTTSLQNTANGSKQKLRSNNKTSRSLPISKSSCGMSIEMYL